MTLDEEVNETQSPEAESVHDFGGDAGSIITALPAVPPPTPASIPSLATEYRPQTVECAH
jgi:hypothetical protein